MGSGNRVYLIRVSRVRIPLSPPKQKSTLGVLFCVANKGERDSKGTAGRRPAKNHPVNGFLVPRAGGATAPVAPGIPLSPPKAAPFRGLFFCARYFPMARLLKRKGPGPLSPAASFCGHTCGVAGP